MAKVNVTIPEDLLELSDEYAKKMYMTRSGFFSQALRAYVDSMRFNNMIDELSLALKRLGTKGNNDEATLSEVDRMLSFIKLVKGQD